jgi:hypothetical protein
MLTEISSDMHNIVPTRYEDPQTQETFAKSISVQKLDNEVNLQLPTNT